MSLAQKEKSGKKKYKAAVKENVKVTPETVQEELPKEQLLEKGRTKEEDIREVVLELELPIKDPLISEEQTYLFEIKQAMSKRVAAELETKKQN